MIKETMIFGLIAAMLFASGCISSQPKAAEIKPVKYVQLNMVDGSTVIAEYINESATFVTIKPLYYTQGTDGQLTNASHRETAIKPDLVLSMVTIQDLNKTIEDFQARDKARAEQEEASRKAAAEADAKLASENAKKMSQHQ